jgi:serine/threonine protein kinase/Flp pilus assembly protein TadD
MPDWNPEANEIFLNALDCRSPDERLALLDSACRGDSGLRSQVDALLAANDRVGSFLEAPAVKAALTYGEPAREAIGTTIGPYKLLEQIGEGGMGVVYMAEQQEPVRRRVALKVIKLGMDTRQVIARFEAERQALALMDHPSIARVLDAGATIAGRPYFVMELVRGTPITEYCDANNLSLRERLELFVQVCHAVQHAHQKGIIHRDLKPSNVLVTLIDGRPVPKVIDFGVAKATGQSLTDKTLFTNFTLMIGTPLYMSPEQAEMTSQDVDTRSDIYSLGVILYELLTGTTPVDQQRLRTLAFDEVRRIIREEEPVRPSSRISTLRSARTATDAARRNRLERLGRLVAGDLDWIVMKALEKNRSRRYDTANSLAADLQRHLNDEPVLARPPSSAYRFSKFARRNRVGILVAALVTAALVAAVVMLAVSNSLIRQEQSRTREEKTHAVLAQQTAEARAEQMKQGVLDLQTAYRLLERGRISMDQQFWDDAESAFTRAIELRPEYAGPWEARADLYLRLGLFDLALHDLNRAHQLQEPTTSWSWVNLALLRFNASDVRGVRQVSAHLRAHVRETATPTFARDTVRVGVLTTDPDGDPLGLAEWAQELANANPKDAFLRYLAGLAHYRAGQFAQADAELQAALTVLPDWDARRIAFPIQAMTYHRLGRKADARSALNAAARAIDDWTGQICRTNNVNWAIHQGVANWPIAWWDWLECQFYFREASLLIDSTAPPEDPRLHLIRARAFAGLRRAEQAIDEYNAAVAGLPDDRQIRFERCRTLGYHYGFLDWARSAREFAEARRLMPDQAGIWNREAISQLAAGNRQSYRQLCQEMLDRFSDTQDPLTATDVVDACVLEADAVPDPSQLIPLAQVAARLNRGAGRMVGAASCRAGRYEDAVRQLEDAARLLQPRCREWCFLAMAHEHLGHTAEAERCLKAAARWLAEASQPTTETLQYSQLVWGGFTERYELPLLYAEAAALIGASNAGSAPGDADGRLKRPPTDGSSPGTTNVQSGQ